MYSKHKKKIWSIVTILTICAGLITLVFYKKIELKIEEDSKSIHTWAFTVRQLLNQQRIEISLNDKIIPNVDSILDDGSTI